MVPECESLIPDEPDVLGDVIEPLPAEPEDEPAVPGLVVLPECGAVILEELDDPGDVVALLPVEPEDEPLPAD
jgi:hypothetical protein